jgi:hypothetical protein
MKNQNVVKPADKKLALKKTIVRSLKVMTGVKAGERR